MGAYRKALAALAGAVVVTLAAASTDNAISTAELVQIVVASLAAFGAYLVPNAPGYALAKSWVAALGAGFGLLGGWLASGEEITSSMWLNFALAIGTSLGVFILPNDPEPVT